MDFLDKNIQKISLSPSILLWVLALVVGVWFVTQVYEILLLLFLAIILSAALEPSIKKLVSFGASRGLAIAGVYVALFAFVFGSLAFLIPTLVQETRQVAYNIPHTLEQWGIASDTARTVSSDLSKYIQQYGESGGSSLMDGVFSTTLGVVKGFVGILAIIAMSLYILAIDGGVEKFFRAVTPDRYREYFVVRAMEAYRKSGRWLAGQVFLMGVVFLLYFILLTALGIPGAFALAVWGGLFEIVPYIGPTLAAIPALILGAFVSPLVAILVLIGYVLIQKLENYWLVPKVMERTLGLHPLVVILVLLIGGQLAGFLGLLISVPLATVAGVFLKDVFEKKTN